MEFVFFFIISFFLYCVCMCVVLCRSHWVSLSSAYHIQELSNSLSQFQLKSKSYTFLAVKLLTYKLRLAKNEQNNMKKSVEIESVGGRCYWEEDWRIECNWYFLFRPIREVPYFALQQLPIVCLINCLPFPLNWI